jgi:hypothetical protein
MVQSLEQYVAQATQAYQPAQTAIQTQLNALNGNLTTAQDTINRNYAQQQSQLESQRNQAAEASSMAAAGSGGSFGGQGNLARRKYYEQSFVPAQTQLQTNQANELSKARQEYENQRTNLNAQLANLESQANQQALQQYWSAIEAEKQRAAAAAQTAAQNSAYERLMNAMANAQGKSKSQVSFVDWVKDYSNWDDNTKNYWVKNINAIYGQKGLAGSQIQNALASRLQNTNAYKQYLNWQRS